MSNYYVSYWVSNEEMDCKYGTYAECQRFIDGMVEDMALNQTSYELIDFTPQPNIQDDDDYDRFMSCPINMNLDEWEQHQDVKAQELADYQEQQDAEPLPF